VCWDLSAWTSALQLAFSSKELRGICESEDAAREQLGMAIANALKRRLADLRAAPTALDLPGIEPTLVEGREGNLMAVALSETIRLTFSVNHPKPPTLSTGEVDWSRVTRIQIATIEDTNG
jgi:hypothetical protein